MLQVGVPAGTGGAEGVAVEGVFDARTGLRGDRLRQLRAQRALGEDRLDVLPSDQVREVAEVLGVRLRLGRLGGDHGPDDLDPVAVGEVVEGVVVGDQLALARRAPCHAARDSCVQRLQLRLVGGGVRLECRPVLRIDLGELRRDLAGRPPRRCAGRATSAGCTCDASGPPDSPGSFTGTAAPRSTTFGVAAAVVDDLVHPGVEVVAVGEDDLGVGRGGDVIGPRLVVVRVGVRGEDLVDVDVRLRRPRGRSRRSGSWWRPPRPCRSPTRSCRSRRRAGRRPVRRPTASPRARGPIARAIAAEAEDRSAQGRDRGPGGRVGLDRQPEPGGALGRGERARSAICQAGIRLANSRTVAAGATNSAATSSAPITLSAAVVASAIRAEQDDVEPACRPRPGPPTSSKPVASQRRPKQHARDQHRRRRDDREPDVSAARPAAGCRRAAARRSSRSGRRRSPGSLRRPGSRPGRAR